jgi:glycosyltransferase involved in cell wall biosynthesis
MIVRDEVMNPLGGLLHMLDLHTPFFKDVAVLDTGSVDGTRQILEHLDGQYDHLHVHDAKFKGFSNARNKAKSFAKLPYVFMLDADEVFFPRYVPEIDTMFMQYPEAPVFSIEISEIRTELKPKKPDHCCWPERLFLNKGSTFKKDVGEYLYHSKDKIEYNRDGIETPTPSNAEILHFRPTKEGEISKEFLPVCLGLWPYLSFCLFISFRTSSAKIDLFV